MRLILKAIYLVSTLLTLAVIVTPFFLLSNTPAVTNSEQIDHESLIQLKKTFYANNPFSPSKTNTKKVIILSEKSLNQAIQLGLQQKRINLPTEIKLNTNIVQLKSSIQIPKTALFINFGSQLIFNNSSLHVTNVFLGRLALPDFITQQLQPVTFAYIKHKFPELADISQLIDQVNVTPEELRISYNLNKQATKKLQSAGRDILLESDDKETIVVYYKKLLEIDKQYKRNFVSMDKLLQPVFELAHQRSIINKDPVQENRAALLALGIMVSEVPIAYIFHDEKMRKANFFRLTLKKRKDLAKHFLMSAALSVISNKVLSESLGLSKEIDDSRGGSGFSFADLLADKSGSHLGKLAISNIDSAFRIQQILADKKISESDFMPEYERLPEALSELKFKKLYVDITHPNYLLIESEINQRINNCLAYKTNA